MNRESKIFVAGGSGMVGSAIIRRLLENGYQNIISNFLKRPPAIHQLPTTFIKLDLTRQDETEDFFKKHKPEYVFLSAAKVGGILANNTYRAECIYDNLSIAMNIIHSAYKYNVKNLLNLGSSCIYPKFAPQPIKEEFLLTGFLEPTNEPYAVAKITAIKLCRYYNEQYGTNFISVMPTNLYGPNDNFNLETAHVLPALIRRFHLAKLLRNKDFVSIRKDIQIYPLGFGLEKEIDLKDENSIKTALKKLGITEDYVVVWGTGEVYREFLHVDDLADACVLLMERVNAQDIKKINQDYFLNVGTGEDIKLKDLFKRIRDTVDFQGEIQHDTSKPDGTPRKLLEVSRIKSVGWKAKMGIEEGIKRTYSWYTKKKGTGYS